MQQQSPAVARAPKVYDAIVVGSGVSGGWAAKELCEKGMKTLVLERGRPLEHRKDYITEHKARWGVEPICRELQVAPSSYYAAIGRPPSARQRRDEVLAGAIRRVWDEHIEIASLDVLKEVYRSTLEQLVAS